MRINAQVANIKTTTCQRDTHSSFISSARFTRAPPTSETTGTIARVCPGSSTCTTMAKSRDGISQSDRKATRFQPKPQPPLRRHANTAGMVHANTPQKVQTNRRVTEVRQRVSEAPNRPELTDAWSET